jgi:gliding motility-associated-like protein
MARFQLIFSILMLSLSTHLIAKKKTTMPPIQVYLTNTDMECGKSTPTTVRVKDFKNVTNFQFTVHFVNSRIKGDSVVKINPKFPETAVTSATMPNGDISFSWSGAPVDLNDGESLFTAYLTPYFYGLTGNGYTPLTIENMPTPIQAYTSASIVVTYPVVTANAQIKIIDKTVPTAICPNSQFYKGLDSVLVANITGVAIDDCGGASITNFKMTGANNITGTNDANGKYYKLGVTKVTYTATDYAGNTAQCPFKIILVKNSDDTITVFANSQLTKCENSSYMDFAVFIGNASTKNLNKLNFSLSWNKQNFQYLSVANLSSSLPGGSFNTSMTADGRLGFTWAGSNLNLSDNQRLFTIRLKPMGLASQTAVMVTGLPTPVAVSSPTNPGYPVRTEPGELFIVDTKAPDLTCRPDTLVYATTPSGPTSIPASAIKPILVENCLLDKYNYKQTLATVAQGAFDENLSYPFNEGITNTSYYALDYGGGTATCNSNLQVNRLKFTVSKDSIPCAIKSSNITVKVKDFEKLNFAKYTITWNPAMVTIDQNAISYYDNTIKNNVTVSGNAAAGALTFTWSLASGSYTLPDDVVMMTLPFTLTGKVNSPITFVLNTGRVINTNTSIVAFATNGSIKNYDSQVPVITNCPADKNEVVTQQGVCSKNVSWAAPTVTDDCDATVANNTKLYKQLGTTFPANTPTFIGDNFGLGQNIISYVATDVFGNTATCSFKINVTENVPPQIVSCVQNVSQSTDPGKNFATVTWSNPSVNESCGIQSEVYSKAKNSGFAVGKQVVIYTVTDKSGNTATCSFNVSVTDNENPSFDPNFPGNITINTKIDTCGAFVTWNLPTAKDNHTPAKDIKITSNYQSGTFFPTGKTTVVYTATDSSGNAVVRNFEINVIDNQIPKFVNCPAQVTVSAIPALCSYNLPAPVLKTKDNCNGTIDVYPNNAPISGIYPIGTTTLNYVDPNDASVKCTVNLVVKVTDKPTFTTPLADITVSTNVGDCKAPSTILQAPTAQDACGKSNTVTITKVPNLTDYPIGKTVVTYTATDSYGNTTTSVVNVFVKDINPPTLGACPKDITANAEPGKSGATITWIPPTAKAFCNGTINLVPTPQQPNTFFKIGDTPITYTATDNSGNTATCTFNVKVIDNQPPTINCPPTKQITVSAAAGSCTQVVPLPTFTDNSGVVPTITNSTGIPAGNIYPVGKTTVSFTVSDNAGNTASCSFDVIVKTTEKPTFSAISDITVNTDPNDCKGTFPATSKPTAKDACGNTTVTITQVPNLTQYPIGTTTVTFTATDSYGNTSSTAVKVTVKDLNPPTMTNCPADITAKAEPGKKGATITWTPPTAKAFCAGTVIITSNNQPNTFYPIGNTVVVYTATDQSGNTLTCSFNINVSDGEPPVINCPPTKQVNLIADSTLCGQNFPLPTFSDNSGILPTIVSSNGIPANNLYPIGKTTVSFTIADNTGNTASCTFDVIVKDLIKPKISNVKDITVNTDPATCTAKLSPANLPQVTDGCGNTTIDIKYNIDTDKLPQGVSTVIVVATDPDGNKSNAIFKVTVVDNVPPVFTACPNKLTLPTDPGKDFATVTWTPPTATDNCSVTVKSSNKPGETFPIGSKIVTYTATDGSGNTSTCTFEVVVTDQEKPTIDCKDITVNSTAGECGGTLVNLPKVTDNVNVVNTVYNPTLPAKNYFNIGTQTFTISATDAAGNLANCILNVVVIDNETPKAANCPKDVTLNAATGVCKMTLSPLPKPTFTDNCNINDVTITSNRDSLAKPTEFNAGETAKVIYYAKDKQGNIGKCEYNVVVTGSSKPIVTCPAAINLSLSPAKCDTIVNWLPATAAVACSPLVGTPKPDINPNTVFKAGTTTVTYSIKDQAGLEGTCSFVVTVKENVKPSFSAAFPKDVELPADSDCSAVYTWSIPTATDNCSPVADLKVEQVAGPKPNDKLSIGVATVTYRVTDKSGNSFDKSFNITVKDKAAPTFVLCPKDVKVDMFGKVVSDPDNFVATVTKSVDCKNVELTFKPIQTNEKCSTPVNLVDSGKPTFALGTPVAYKYTATDAAGNTAECKFNVTVEGIALPTVSANLTSASAANKNMGCPGSDIQLTAGSLVGATYAWTGPNGFTSTEQSPTVKNASSINAGDYTLIVTKDGCTSTSTAPLKVDFLKKPKTKEDDYTVYSGDLLQADVFPNDSLIAGESTIVKITEDVKNGSLKMRNDGKFDYTSKANFFGNDNFKYDVCYENCPNTACSGPTLARIVVKLKEVKVPNVISPNDDGQNDILTIDYPFNGTEKSELYIYNEWGHLVYDKKPYTNADAWKGTFQGRPVPDGTYYFVFIVDTGAKPVKGFVTVLR